MVLGALTPLRASVIPPSSQRLRVQTCLRASAFPPSSQRLREQIRSMPATAPSAAYPAHRSIPKATTSTKRTRRLSQPNPLWASARPMRRRVSGPVVAQRIGRCPSTGTTLLGAARQPKTRSSPEMRTPTRRLVSTRPHHHLIMLHRMREFRGAQSPRRLHPSRLRKQRQSRAEPRGKP